ncbi:MAG TPA: beta-phosphoglucomutase [Caldilineaceae bacterium]|nr:beta-phosphoglucomutase [Caldilineaceae bacterium]
MLKDSVLDVSRRGRKSAMHPPIHALLFDLDGVITDTAEYHYRAWKKLADEEGIPFSRQDNEQLRGVSRRESLNRLLKGREIDEETAQTWMARKNSYYREMIETISQKDLLPGAAELLAQARAAGLRIALVSASRNAPEVVERLGIAALFDVIATGGDVVRQKPSPDLFLYAAEQLDVAPGQCLVVEDAESGIEAARAAGMVSVGLGPAERVGYADLVLPSLEGVQVDDLLRAAAWRVTENYFDPSQQYYRETIFTIGNGYLGARGTFEEGYPDHRQATLIHGIWDDAPLVYTELVNAFDWTTLDIWVNGQPFRMDRGTISHYVRHLDMKTGELHRRLRWTPSGGPTVELRFTRFAALDNPHALAVRVQVIALDEPATVVVRARLDGHVENEGLLHWRQMEQWEERGTVYLRARTRRDEHAVIEAMRVAQAGAVADIRYADCPRSPGMQLEAALEPGQRWTVDKLVAVYTDRDGVDMDAAAGEEIEALARMGFDRLQANNRAAWAAFWNDSDVIIEGDDEAQQAIRHALFQLRIAAPSHDERVSIGAKSLSGFGYRGHVFWDTEIFMLPFFTFTQPKLARNLLMYRWHTLPGARRKASAGGFEGAQYAWESAETGDEVTPRWVLPPLEGIRWPAGDTRLIRIWCGDIEIHISADIAYAIWQYWQVTGDDAFMRNYGAQILLETARFWESRVEPDAHEPGYYSISDVIGPDEYHEHVDNNAFTNRMAAWHLQRALEVLGWLENNAPQRADELKIDLNLSVERLARWRSISDNLLVLHNAETGLIEQFKGFFELAEVEWERYEGRTTSMQSLLGMEGTNARQVLKQPDVILLLCLLQDQYGKKEWQANWDYYVPRTDHTYGSSLGPAIHAWAACIMDQPELAYDFFMLAARADIDDVRGNAGDGIHAASAGGIWQAAVFGFGGLRIHGNEYTVTPRLPAHWRRLAFKFYLCGQQHQVDLRND